MVAKWHSKMSQTRLEEERRTMAILQTDLPKGRLDHTKIYPEFHLQRPYGVWNQAAPVQAFLPFYKTIIVLVEPFQDRRLFKQYYGLDLEDLMALRRENRVVALAGNYDEYPAWYKDFFAVDHIPSWTRIAITAQYVLSASFNHAARIEQLFSRVTIKDTSDSLLDFMSPLFRNFLGDPKENFIRLEKSRAYRLSVLGYNQLLEQLATVKNQNSFLFLIYLCDSMISWPVYFSLGGYTNQDTSWYSLGKRILTDMQIGKPDETLVLANECLLSQLSVELGYGHPINYPPLEFARRIDSISEIGENHKILSRIEEQLERCEFHAAFDQSQQAAELMKHVNVEIEKIGKSYKIAGYVLRPAFALLSSSAVEALSRFFSQIPSEIALPLGGLGGLALSTVDVVRARLDGLARLLTGAWFGRNSTPFLLWQRRDRVQRA